MGEFVTDCPRCGASKSTHDVLGGAVTRLHFKSDFRRGSPSWKPAIVGEAELACICRNCGKGSFHWVSASAAGASLFKELGLSPRFATIGGAITPLVSSTRAISEWDLAVESPPEHLPADIQQVIEEANKCLSAGCWNASAAMYRLALDMATKARLPENGEPSQNVRRSLGLRIQWLLAQNRLPESLGRLIDCIREDGNDGAHAGTVSCEVAEDLREFSYRLLESLYSEPMRLEMAEQRRAARRGGVKQASEAGKRSE